MRYLLILLLAGCASTQDAGIRIVWHKLEGNTYRFETSGVGIKEGSEVRGFSRMVDGVCHVWASDPQVEIVDGKRTFKHGQWATLGHEVKHCFDGKFHD